MKNIVRYTSNQSTGVIGIEKNLAIAEFLNEFLKGETLIDYEVIGEEMEVLTPNYQEFLNHLGREEIYVKLEASDRLQASLVLIGLKDLISTKQGLEFNPEDPDFKTWFYWCEKMREILLSQDQGDLYNQIKAIAAVYFVNLP
jgi:hypothetical protein